MSDYVDDELDRADAEQAEEDLSAALANESSCDFLKRVGMDADKWAKEFVRINPDSSDIDTMRAWFANAIMAGYDHANWKHAEDLLKKLKSPSEGSGE